MPVILGVMAIAHHLSRFLVPRFTDLDLFALGYTVFMVAAWRTHDILQPASPAGDSMFLGPDVAPLFLGTFFGIYGIVATYHVFSEKQKSILTGQLMLVMALVIMVFSAAMLIVHSAERMLPWPLFFIQVMYILWLVLLLRTIADGNHELQSRMLVPKDEARISALLVGIVVFSTAATLFLFFHMSWPLVLAYLTIFAIPVSRFVASLGHFFYVHEHFSISRRDEVVGLILLLLVAGALGYLAV